MLNQHKPPYDFGYSTYKLIRFVVLVIAGLVVIRGGLEMLGALGF